MSLPEVLISHTCPMSFTTNAHGMQKFMCTGAEEQPESVEMENALLSSRQTTTRLSKTFARCSRKLKMTFKCLKWNTLCLKRSNLWLTLPKMLRRVCIDQTKMRKLLTGWYKLRKMQTLLLTKLCSMKSQRSLAPKLRRDWETSWRIQDFRSLNMIILFSANVSPRPSKKKWL